MPQYPGDKRHARMAIVEDSDKAQDRWDIWGPQKQQRGGVEVLVEVLVVVVMVMVMMENTVARYQPVAARALVAAARALVAAARALVAAARALVVAARALVAAARTRMAADPLAHAYQTDLPRPN